MTDINGSSSVIDRDDVEIRIKELEDSRGYEVTRVRNQQVLARFTDEGEAARYIEDEDYNPERVVVRRLELNDVEAVYLRKLRKLIADVVAPDDWSLYNAGYFSATWAKQEARVVLGSSPAIDFGAWPLSEIDWADAAERQRDTLYQDAYEFDGGTFYGE